MLHWGICLFCLVMRTGRAQSLATRFGYRKKPLHIEVVYIYRRIDPKCTQKAWNLTFSNKTKLILWTKLWINPSISIISLSLFFCLTVPVLSFYYQKNCFLFMRHGQQLLNVTRYKWTRFQDSRLHKLKETFQYWFERLIKTKVVKLLNQILILTRNIIC